VNIADLPIGSDWTGNGVKSLSLWFSGDVNNVPEQMYVKLNGVKVPYDGDAGNIMKSPWHPWNINLADFTGVDLSNVTELIIGFERGAGGMGKVLFDDIRLYPLERQLIAPVEPNNANLAAYWQFDGNFSDSSGNGLHGIAMGETTFVAGKIGQAISLRGLNDYVEITGYKGILGPNAFSIAAWIKTTDNGVIVGWGRDRGTGDDNVRLEFRTNGGRLRIEHGGGSFQGDTTMTDDDWHHVAVTKKENGILQSPDTNLYIDGVLDATRGGDPNQTNIEALHDVTIGREHDREDRWLEGLLDDLRIYNYELSHAEIAWLAGVTLPFDKPF
jgi:hypothetical protein